LRTVDLARVERELRARVEQVPHLFRGAPAVVDVGELADGATGLDLAELARVFRRCTLVPVAVANLPPEKIDRANEAGLGLILLGRPRKEPEPAPAPVEPPPPPALAEPARTLTIKQPVRGGQVIYAQRADLVVLAAVNAGAQVIADGHIHIYGPLRGRALAGAGGTTDARVFCQSLDAELVSVAGVYLPADQIPDERRGRPAQILLQEGQCRILPL
jgi:septum site-determining protein MinC